MERNKACEGCTAKRCDRKEPSNRDWLETTEELQNLMHDKAEFIPVDRMCLYESIFGNDFIGFTLEDLERLKNGEVFHIPGEYGIFIGMAKEDNDA